MKKLLVISGLFLLLFSFNAQAQSCCLPKNDKKVEKANINMQETKTVTLKVTGMTCMSCSNHVMKALEKVEGVIEPLVEYKEDRAVVTFSPKLTTVEAIIEAINKTPYKASLMEPKS